MSLKPGQRILIKVDYRHPLFDVLKKNEYDKFTDKFSKKFYTMISDSNEFTYNFGRDPIDHNNQHSAECTLHEDPSSGYWYITTTFSEFRIYCSVFLQLSRYMTEIR